MRPLLTTLTLIPFVVVALVGCVTPRADLIPVAAEQGARLTDALGKFACDGAPPMCPTRRPMTPRCRKHGRPLPA
jgi:hypothetical protein